MGLLGLILDRLALAVLGILHLEGLDVHLGLAMAYVAQKQDAQALKELETAVRLRPNHTDAINNLGVVLLRMGKAQEAETVYREDLQQNPANGWSLFGLSAALKSQGKTAEASTVAQQFETAWKYADVKLVASAF